jgi:hypothetical protein
VEPTVSNLAENTDQIITLTSPDSIHFFKILARVNQNTLSTLALSISDVVGGAVELALAHNKLPLWHAQTRSESQSNVSFCMANFSCSLYVDVCEFETSGLYMAAVRPGRILSPWTPISLRIRANLFSSYVGETELTPNANYPHTINPGDLRLFDVNMRGIDGGDDLHLELYSASPNEKVRLTVLRYPSETCFEEILDCETRPSETSESTSCLIEIPECLLREQRHLNDDKVRIAVQWNPDHPAGSLEYTIKVSSAAVQQISESFLHRDRLVAGQSTQFMVSPHALPPNSALELTVTCLLGKISLFEKFV